TYGACVSWSHISIDETMRVDIVVRGRLQLRAGALDQAQQRRPAITVGERPRVPGAELGAVVMAPARLQRMRACPQLVQRKPGIRVAPGRVVGGIAGESFLATLRPQLYTIAAEAQGVLPQVLVLGRAKPTRTHGA